MSVAMTEAAHQREIEVRRLAEKMHRAEHPLADMSECQVPWHTETWFTHCAQATYRTGRRD